MRFSLNRFTNTLILSFVSVLTLTGVYGLFWTLQGWAFDLHRISGWLLVAVIPWKVGISARSLRRGLSASFDRGMMVALSLLLSAATLLVLLLGLLWSWRLGQQEYWMRQTAISWHWMLALGLMAPFAIHVWRRWPRPKKVDLISRRAALKALGLVAAGLAAWWAGEALSTRRASPGSEERFTGSRLAGMFTGNRYPITHTRAPAEEQVKSAAWQLALGGAVSQPRAFTYEELLALPASETTATLDCTLGWYTTQVWKGVPLLDLLDAAGREPDSAGVRLESVTGYAHILPMAEAKGVLLATHVGGEALHYSHGFPLRAVVPTRRGWFWVKWLTRIDVIAL